MTCAIRPAAQEDILRQYRYYLIEKDAEVAAERFLVRVQQAVENLSNAPLTGAPKVFSHVALRGLRTWPVKGFPEIRIYYLADEKAVRILRVLHGKRDVDAIFSEALADEDA